MAQIKVNSGLVRPKAINVFMNGSWATRKIGKIFNAGTWKNFIQYLLEVYTLGVEHIPIVQGYRYNTNDMFKRENYLELVSDTANGNELACVTDTMIDLTNYSTVFVQWSGYSGYIDGRCILIASTTKNNNRTVYDAITAYDPPGTTERTQITSALNVSSLSGQYYIRVHSYIAETRVYKIWME